MPRRDEYDDDDDYPHRPSRRPRYDDDDEDDFDDRPRRRRRPKKSDNTPIVIGLVAGGLILFLAVVVGGFFAFRAAKRVQVGPPMAIAGQGNNPQAVFVPPGVPQNVIPDEVAIECTISNLRQEAGGIGGRRVLTFNYQFHNGRPPAGANFYLAVIMQPGKQDIRVHLGGAIGAQDKITLNQPGGFANAKVGTTIYLAKGPGTPRRISNMLTIH